ncbi:hypothetical protein VTN96DRAFT_2693 [Rasamsonia emersonii]|uniref:Uncharacterized protein n=1 Tax=Rasamsonia emersonii (strain ATCC 16479 / CBS 393.64 / IMI 116815) TaxID=1408163 RepID=A0A0F4YFL1_RASE3|nr:hypothetical protein T310_9692 [Rasamsonia emersonii CBS 393.64]KKA16711.1 hypothetical protein T310_9692 [Rasamsonia emersonii CBS 393.64]
MLQTLDSQPSLKPSYSNSNSGDKPPGLLRLPPELRLKIYEYVLDTPNDYLDRPLIVLDDRGSSFTARGRYRALSMNPTWQGGGDGRSRKLLSVNRQIHDEAEDFLYSHYTFFFRNSFNLERAGDFLDTLSATARSRIRNVGFEIFFFVHNQTGVPKRTLKLYGQVGKMMQERLPRWKSVIFYLDPRFYFPTPQVGGKELAARGVFYLATIFGALGKEVTFYPVQPIHRHVIEEAERQVRRGSRSQDRPSL